MSFLSLFLQASILFLVVLQNLYIFAFFLCIFVSFYLAFQNILEVKCRYLYFIIFLFTDAFIHLFFHWILHWLFSFKQLSRFILWILFRLELILLRNYFKWGIFLRSTAFILIFRFNFFIEAKNNWLKLHAIVVAFLEGQYWRYWKAWLSAIGFLLFFCHWWPSSRYNNWHN